MAWDNLDDLDRSAESLQAEIKKAIAEGPSKLVRDPEAAQCCREEALQKVEEGHC